MKSVVLTILFIGISACSKNKPEKVQAFCSELTGSHIRIKGCHWQGKIRMDVVDARSMDAKPMVIWIADANNGEVNMYNMASKKAMPNPLATQKELMQAEPKKMKKFVEQKQKNDELIAKTSAEKGKSSLNNNSSRDCVWYKLIEPVENKIRFDDVCVAKSDEKLVKAYMEFIDTVKKIDERFYPVPMDGLPILSWRMPFNNPWGFIEPRHLPKIFVTGRNDKRNPRLMRSTFSYKIEDMSPKDFDFVPEWAKEK